MKVALWLMPFLLAAQSPQPVVTSPVLIKQSAPEYTAEARAAGLQGTVWLYLEVGADGKPVDVQITHGLGLGLDEKAVQAAQEWVYQPATREGQPIKALGQSASVTFRLEGGGPWRVRQTAYALERDRDPVAPDDLVAVTPPVPVRLSMPNSASCPADATYAAVQFRVAADGTAQDFGPSPDAGTKAATQALKGWSFTPGKTRRGAHAYTALVEFECGSPAPGSPEGSPMRVGRGVAAPAIVYKRDPEYSDAARRVKFQGTVILNVVVDTTGHVSDASIVRPLFHGLDQNAIAAVQLWRFRPGTKDGRPVKVQATLEITFRLM